MIAPTANQPILVDRLRAVDGWRLSAGMTKASALRLEAGSEIDRLNNQRRELQIENEILKARVAASRLDSMRDLIKQGWTAPLLSPAGSGDDFLHGICVALQVVTAMGCGVTWTEIVRTAGERELLHYAAHIEPEEWELAGFAKFAKAELRRNKPRKKA